MVRDAAKREADSEHGKLSLGKPECAAAEEEKNNAYAGTPSQRTSLVLTINDSAGDVTNRRHGFDPIELGATGDSVLVGTNIWRPVVRASDICSWIGKAFFSR
jgi:hypothetical protein